MLQLREYSALALFVLGLGLLFKVCVSTYVAVMVIFAVACLLLAYFIWPSKKRGRRNDDSYVWDILEFLIELPVEIFIWAFRLLFRAFRKADLPDIDI